MSKYPESIHVKVCSMCGKPFTAERTDAKFCSGACRARHSRLTWSSIEIKQKKKRSRSKKDEVKAEVTKKNRSQQKENPELPVIKDIRFLNMVRTSFNSGDSEFCVNWDEGLPDRFRIGDFIVSVLSRDVDDIFVGFKSVRYKVEKI